MQQDHLIVTEGFQVEGLIDPRVSGSNTLRVWVSIRLKVRKHHNCRPFNMWICEME